MIKMWTRAIPYCQRKKRLGTQNVEIIEGPLARKNLGVVGKGKRSLENKMLKY